MYATYLKNSTFQGSEKTEVQTQASRKHTLLNCRILLTSRRDVAEAVALASLNSRRDPEKENFTSKLGRLATILKNQVARLPGWRLL